MITPRPSWRHLLTWRRALLVVAVALLVGVLLGCLGPSRPAPADPPSSDHPEAELPARSAPAETPAPAGESPEAALVRRLRDRLATVEGEAAGIRTKLARAEDAQRQADAERRLAPVRAAITWVTWIGALAGAAGVALQLALFFWSLPIGRGTAWALIAGGPLVACFAQGFGLALPWLPVLGLCLLGLGLVVLVVLIVRRWSTAHAILADEYRRGMEKLGEIAPRARLDLDDVAVKRQRAAGVLGINDRALGKRKEAA